MKQPARLSFCELGSPSRPWSPRPRVGHRSGPWSPSATYVSSLLRAVRGAAQTSPASQGRVSLTGEKARPREPLWRLKVASPASSDPHPGQRGLSAAQAGGGRSQGSPSRPQDPHGGRPVVPARRPRTSPRRVRGATPPGDAESRLQRMAGIPTPDRRLGADFSPFREVFSSLLTFPPLWGPGRDRGSISVGSLHLRAARAGVSWRFPGAELHSHGRRCGAASVW